MKVSIFYNATGKQSYLNELKSKNMDINKVIESNLKTHYANLRTTEEAQINILKAVSQEIEKVKDNVVLPDVMNSFYDWHKQKGYITLKRDDFDEYLNSLKK